MARPYSLDLRERVVAAIEGSEGYEETAARFRVGVSTVERWMHQWRTRGTAVARPMGGDHRSRLTGQRDWLLALVAAQPDLTLAEIREALARERKVRVGYGAVWRFFARERISFKKNSACRRAGSA